MSNKATADSRSKPFLGIDIGGTKCAVLLAGYDGSAVSFTDKISFNTKDYPGPDAAIRMIISESKRLIERNGLRNEDIAAAGINCGGPLDSKRGVILCPPNLTGWINIPISAIVEEQLGIKAYLQNDANAGAIAEYMFGAGRGKENIMFLTFGTGMGAGLILNGKLYSGTNDMAGEVGHIRLDNFGPAGFGKTGSFEGFCSGGGIAQLARTMTLSKLQVGEKVSFCEDMDGLGLLTAKLIADTAKNGDTFAMEILAVCGRYLGKALSLFIDILNPQMIILGSIYMHTKDLLWPHIKNVIDAEALPFSRAVCEITESGLGEAINDYEAVSIAVYNSLIKI